MAKELHSRVAPEVQRAREELRTLRPTDPEHVRARCLAWIRHLAGAPIAAWYTMTEVAGHPAPSHWLEDAAPGWTGVADRALRNMGEFATGWPVGSPHRPRRDWDSHFYEGSVLWPDRRQLEQSLMYRRVWAPLGMRDQIRLLVYRGGRFVGWVGAVRGENDPLFGETERAALQPLVGSIAAALTAADAAQTRGGDWGASADLVVRPDGAIEYANGNLRAWLARRARRDRVAALIRQADRGHAEGRTFVDGAQARWTRPQGAQGGTRYLLHLSWPEPVQLAPEAELTEMQREVAELASSGATLREIGDALGITRHTARSHLRACYRHFGVNARTDLAKRLAR
jgi:DNA-binding CsgD family transcriptional regulator